MPWRIEYDGHVLREVDITLGQAARVEKLTGDSWLLINPYRRAEHARALLTVMYADATKSRIEDVAAKVDNLTVNEFSAMVGDEPEDLPSEYTDGFPQPADGTSTST